MRINNMSNLTAFLFNANRLPKQKAEFANFFDLHKTYPQHQFLRLMSYRSKIFELQTMFIVPTEPVFLMAALRWFYSPHSAYICPFPNHISSGFEVTSLIIQTSQVGCLKLISKRLHVSLANFDFEDTPIFLGGDFNAKDELCHSSTDNTCGKVLANFAEITVSSFWWHCCLNDNVFQFF